MADADLYKARLERERKARKEAERIAERATRELYEARLVAESATRAKTEFMAAINHELRTPLNVIIGMADILKLKASDRLTAEELAYIGDITGQATALQELLGRVLEMVRIESDDAGLESEYINPEAAIATACSLARAKANKQSVNLICEVAQDLPIVTGNGSGLDRALHQLIDNAIAFAGDAKRVAVSVHALDDSWVTFDVRDWGLGIPQHELKRVTLPFYQVNGTLARTHEGAGLGLAIAKGLVEAMGGRFQMTSVVGNGTRASILLPLATQVEPPAPAGRSDELALEALSWGA